MNCNKRVYDKGSSWFKRLVDKYSKYNIHFKENKKYSFCEVYYKSGVYNLYLLNVPILLTEINYRTQISKDVLHNQTRYNELLANGRIQNVIDSTDVVKGYWATIHKIDKRFYLLRNSQEFLKGVEMLSKNRA